MSRKCEIPFEMVQGLLVVRASVLSRIKTYHSLGFAVDTGATISVLNKNIAEKCGFFSKQKFEDFSVANSNGTHSGYKVRVPEFILGPIKIKNMTLGVLTLPPTQAYHGIIGLDVLKNFNLTFDFTQQKIILSELSKISSALKEAN